MHADRPTQNAGDETGLTASWIPGWYELDQTVVVGQRDLFYFYDVDQIPIVDGQRFFYFQKDGTRPLASEGVVPHELVFANGSYESSFEVRATIQGIYNSVFGEIRGILADGLDYRVVTADGRAFKIEAEEDPGFVYALGRHLQDQHFIVHLADVERTGESLSSRRQATSRDKQLEEEKKRWAGIQELIEPFELVEIGVAASGFSGMTLDEIAAQEHHLLSLIPPYGYFEERGPQVEAAGLPARWQEIFAAYIERVGHDSDGREALARAVFLAWYSYNEPWQLAGIRDLPLAQVAQVLKELDCLNRFLASIEGSYSPDAPLRPMEERGALGTYWLSREDATFR